MSFSAIVKNEITKLEASPTADIAELSALIRLNGNLTLTSGGMAIEIQTENASIARRIYKLIKEQYQIQCELVVRKRVKLKKNHIYIVRVNKNANEILEDLSILGDTGFSSQPKEYLVDDYETKRAYIRGAFLARGSVNDPKTARYHLEIIFLDKKHAQFVNNIMNGFELNSKVISRKKGYVVYIKEAEKISDFMRFIGASSGVMYFENIRIYRDHKNMINRLNNCEQANIERSMKSAQDQIDNIMLIKEEMGLELLNDKVKVVAEYRLKYEDVSLQELSEIITHETGEKITKSGINHRMRKIKEIANKIRETKEG